MGVMNQPVEDSISDGGTADLFMPVLHGELTGDDGGGMTMSKNITHMPDKPFRGEIRRGWDVSFHGLCARCAGSARRAAGSVSTFASAVRTVERF